MKGSHDRANGLGAMHLVSVWISDFGLTLAQVATEEKSNEITAIPEVLRLVDLKGAIITIDAMGTQTAIADQIVAGDGDYILAWRIRRGHSTLQSDGNKSICCSLSIHQNSGRAAQRFAFYEFHLGPDRAA